MYRPKGWENPYDFMSGGAIPKYEAQSRVFEEGADAMLAELKKNGLYGEMCEDYIISTAVRVDDPDWAEPFYESIQGKGWLVFISKE